MAEEKQNQEQEELEELNQTEAEEAEVEAEQAASEADEQAEENQTELLEKQLKELQERLDEKENKLLRVQADFENYKRRARLDLEAAENTVHSASSAICSRRSTTLNAPSGSILTTNRRKACRKEWKWCTVKFWMHFKTKALKSFLLWANNSTRICIRP